MILKTSKDKNVFQIDKNVIICFSLPCCITQKWFHNDLTRLIISVSPHFESLDIITLFSNFGFWISIGRSFRMSRILVFEQCSIRVNSMVFQFKKRYFKNIKKYLQTVIEESSINLWSLLESYNILYNRFKEQSTWTQFLQRSKDRTSSNFTNSNDKRKHDFVRSESIWRNKLVCGCRRRLCASDGRGRVPFDLSRR